MAQSAGGPGGGLTKDEEDALARSINKLHEGMKNPDIPVAKEVEMSEAKAEAQKTQES